MNPIAKDFICGLRHRLIKRLAGKDCIIINAEIFGGTVRVSAKTMLMENVTIQGRRMEVKGEDHFQWFEPQRPAYSAIYVAR